MNGRQGRPGRLTREKEPRAWGSIALAVGIASLGVQVGWLTWQTPAVPSPKTALRWEPGPPIPLEPALGHRTGSTTPGVGRLARATASAPVENPAPGESQTPSPAPTPFPKPPAGFIGPIAPPGPGYLGKPLPLPNQDQVRFLLRHDPVASVPAADPLRIAPLSPPAAAPPSASRPALRSPAAATRSAPANALTSKETAAGRLTQPDSIALVPGFPPLATSPFQPTTASPLAPPKGVTPASGTPAAAAAGQDPGGAATPQRSASPRETPSGAAHGTPEKSSDAAAPAPAPGSSPAAPGPDASPAPVTARATSPGTLPAAGTAAAPTVETKGAGTERPRPETAGRGAVSDDPVNRRAEPSPPLPQLHSSEPLRLQLGIDGGSGRRFASGQMAQVNVTASAPCHVVVYRIDVHGRITPLLSLAGSARMKPASAFSLAVKASPIMTVKTPDYIPGTLFRDRVIAIGSRRPLAGREVELCLRGFTPEGDEESGDPAQPVQEMPLAAALRTLADYAGRQPAGLTAAPGGATPAGATCAVESFLVEAR